MRISLWGLPWQCFCSDIYSLFNLQCTPRSCSFPIKVQTDALILIYKFQILLYSAMYFFLRKSFFCCILNGQDAVTVVGYPLGGDTISVTKGVVSRIEVWIVNLFLACQWLSVWCSSLTTMYKQIFCIVLSNILSSGYIVCSWIIWFVGYSNWRSNKSWLVCICICLFICLSILYVKTSSGYVFAFWRLHIFGFITFTIPSVSMHVCLPLSFIYFKVLSHLCDSYCLY